MRGKAGGMTFPRKLPTARWQSQSQPSAMFFIVSFTESQPYTRLPRSRQCQKELSHTILLHPSYFGAQMLQFLESKLYADVEGTCSGQFGYIIAVVSILDIGKGMVTGGTGQAEFITRYRAIVFKPFKGEVVDGVVNNVNKVRSPSGLSHAVYELWKLRQDGFLCGRWTVVGFCVSSGTRFPLPNVLSLKAEIFSSYTRT
jgi:hypothetical protein